MCGGRLYSDWATLDKMLGQANPTCVITGGASGADNMAERWASEHSIRLDVYRADWKTHGRAAGPIRNQRMLDHGKPDMVLAFPGGRGTADMVRRALAAGVQVCEVNADGTCGVSL